MARLSVLFNILFSVIFSKQTSDKQSHILKFYNLYLSVQYVP